MAYKSETGLKVGLEIHEIGLRAANDVSLAEFMAEKSSKNFYPKTSTFFDLICQPKFGYLKIKLNILPGIWSVVKSRHVVKLRHVVYLVEKFKKAKKDQQIQWPKLGVDPILESMKQVSKTNCSDAVSLGVEPKKSRVSIRGV